MTWHFFSPEEFECPSCSAEFIPFETPQTCPRCGHLSYSETSFLSDIVGGLRVHKKDYGTYTSGAYFVGSQAENIFYWCCCLLDEVSKEGEVPTIEAVRCRLDAVDWGDNSHMKTYFGGLLSLVIPQLSSVDNEPL